jgi:LCP family protein required for cell wall assembly
MKKWKWIIITIIIVLLATIGYYVYSLYAFANHISKKSLESPHFPISVSKQNPPPKWEGKERVNILLLGGDSRGLKKNEIPRSDSMTLLSIDPLTKKGAMMSIMRDTWVKIAGQGDNRINAAIAFGGPNLAMKTVSDLIGMPVQYYVYTDFQGFIALVDAIDGITIDVEKDMKWTDSEDDHVYDINLKKGEQHVDGKTALQYVRFRHDAMSDFARSDRQRKFMKAVGAKMQSTTSILRLPSILSKIDPYIETNMQVGDMINLATLAWDIRTDTLISQQLPPNELLQERNIGGAEVIIADKAQLQRYVKALLSDKLLDGKPLESAKPAITPKAAPKPTPTPKPKPKPTPTPTPTPAVSPVGSVQPNNGEIEIIPGGQE